MEPTTETKKVTREELVQTLRSLTEHDECQIEAGNYNHFIEVEHSRALLDRIDAEEE